MKKKPLLVLTFLLVLFIGPSIFVMSYSHTSIVTEPNMSKEKQATLADGEAWLEGWDWRIEVSIDPSESGAGTNYQIRAVVTYNDDMEVDFDDIRFTDDDGETLLDYWRETYTASTSAAFWVEVADDLDTAGNIYMYYGNAEVSTTSNGHTTFQEFYDKDSTAGWSTSFITVTTSGDFLRFYNPVVGDLGSATRTDMTLSTDFQYMAQYKTVSLGATDSGTTIIMDGSTSDRFSQSMSPLAAQQAQWHYYDGATKQGGVWAEGTEFIFTMQVDEGDAATGIDYRRYDTSWGLLDSVLGENFALGAPTDCDGIGIGDMTSGGTIDAYFRWIAFRKCIDTISFEVLFGDEENKDTSVATAGSFVGTGEINSWTSTQLKDGTDWYGDASCTLILNFTITSDTSEFDYHVYAYREGAVSGGAWLEVYNFVSPSWVGLDTLTDSPAWYNGTVSNSDYMDTTNNVVMLRLDSDFLYYPRWDYAEIRIYFGDPPNWNEIAIAEFVFPVGWTPEQQFGYDMFFIVLGLTMIPLSTLYLVRGGMKDMNRDKLFYGLIILIMGLGLVIGGVMP